MGQSSPQFRGSNHMLNLRKRSIYVKHRALFILAGIIVEVVILAALVVLAAIVFGSAYFRVVEHPKFCGSLCHNMEASYESYKKSAHGGIHCAECHSRTGFVDGFLKDTIYAAGKEVFVYLEGEAFYDMDELHPRIPNESCLRHECHKIESLIERKSLFKEDNIFQHSSHMPDISPALNCSSCHSQSKEKHMAVDQRVCFLCHFADSSSEKMQECSSCHAVLALKHDDEPYRDYMGVEEDLPACNECHGFETQKIVAPSEKCDECHHAKMEPLDAASAHEKHIRSQKARCMECHEPIEHE